MRQQSFISKPSNLRQVSASDLLQTKACIPLPSTAFISLKRSLVPLAASIFVLAGSCIFICATQALAQSNQLGNASVTPGSVSKYEPYGVNSATESAGSDPFLTRHRREGNEGGIGSSFLGTTSVTSESKPVGVETSALQSKSPAVPIQDSFRPRTFSESMMYTPAFSRPYYTSPSISSSSEYNYGTVQSTDSVPFDALWGHKRAWGSYQSSTGTSRGFDLFLQ